MSESPEPGVGQRIKFFRERRGMSREVLGGLVGRSKYWVKAVERGEIREPRLPVLLSIAEALKLRDIAELTGGRPLPTSMFRGPGHPALTAVRDAINSVAAPPPGPVPPLVHLQARLDAAWRARHAAPDHRTVLGGLLPDLIRDARHAARVHEGADRRRAMALLAQTYHLAQFFLAYQPAPELLWRVVERSLTAAEEADDPHAFGGAVWLAAQAHRDAGDLDAAEAVNREGLERLASHVEDGDDHVRAMWGALLHEAAYTAARAGQRGTAWRWWSKADEVARRLPADHYDPMTSFGRAIMGAHAVTIAVEGRQAGEAGRQAAAMGAAPIPSQPRRARHLIEVARAWRLTGDDDAALAALDRAYVTAPETIRYNAYARRMVTELSEGPASLRRDVRHLADRIGLPA